jgi:hypothetical protein
MARKSVALERAFATRNNWEPISQTDYLFELWALDQQWIRAMLRLSNKAAALIVKIEKQYTCRHATPVSCERA